MILPFNTKLFGQGYLISVTDGGAVPRLGSIIGFLCSHCTVSDLENHDYTDEHRFAHQ
jgi:hypothetical protein